MTISQLTYALAVAKHQNFTAAANECAVTQPTLSMQIQKLEEQLGVAIFNRKKKPVTLTEIGKKIIEQARIIVAESKRVTDIVEQEKGYIGGEFHLGIIPTIMPTLLPLFLKNFTSKYPKLKLIIKEVTTDEMIKQLSEEKLDAGIAATPLKNDLIKELPLYYEPFVGFIPEKYKELYSKKQITVDDLSIDNILLLKNGHCFTDTVINICEAHKTNNSLPFVIESGNFNTLINLSKEGMGMTLLPYLQTMHLSESNRAFLKEFKSPAPAREVSIIHAKSQLKIHIITALKNVIDSVIRSIIYFEDVKIISPLKK